VNIILIAALIAGDDKAEAGEHDHQIDAPQHRRRPEPAGQIAQRAGLADEARDPVPPDGECFGADHEQVEDACHDDDADDAHRDGAAGVLCLLAQRGRRLEAGEGGKAVDHRIREVGEPLVGRQYAKIIIQPVRKPATGPRPRLLYV
jgi:hypothetical protein